MSLVQGMPAEAGVLEEPRRLVDLVVPAGAVESRGGWDARLADLEKLHDYRDDWDGQGAPAPRADQITAAQRLASLLRQRGWPAPLFAVAGVDGSVNLEWHLAVGYVDFTVLRDLTIEGYRSDGGGSPEAFPLLLDGDRA